MSKSRKRKNSDSMEEVERLMLVVRKMEEDLRAKEDELKTKEDALRARDVEVESLRWERDRMYLTVSVAQTVQTPRRHVNDLPDHLLLRIFGLLDHTYLADVVCCVCKRWCNLVGEPSLWNGVTLAYGNSKGLQTGAMAFMRTLNAAPMLHALECGLSPADPHAVLHHLENCNTAASHVCFDLDTAAADAVLRVLWNSRSLIRELCLREGPLGQSDFSHSQACRFWETLEESPQLTTLVLFLRQKGGLANSLYSFRPSARPSLRTLYMDVGVVDEHALWTQPQLGVAATTIASTLITAHRATLEDVKLPMRAVCSPTVVKALSRCPQLCKARVPVGLEVHHLARCQHLRKLHLTADHVQRAVNTERLLHSICQLRQLEQLTVSPLGWCCDAYAVANGLITALDNLVELRRLNLSCLPAAETLDWLAESPSAAPHLELLHFGQSCGEAVVGACRLPALRRLLQLRRHLHVSLGSLKVYDGGLVPGRGPRCGKDHCSLAATNPVLPVAFVNHVAQVDQACATCASFVQRLSGSILYLIEDGEFLDVPWRDASDLSVSSTPVKVAPASGTEQKPVEYDSDSTPDSPALVQPNKVRVTSAPARSGQAPKKVQTKPRPKANSKPKAKPSAKAIAKPRPMKQAKRPSQVKRKPAASGCGDVIPKVEGPTDDFLKVALDLNRSQSVSPRPSSEVDQPINSPPPIEESVLMSSFPDMILPPVADGKGDTFVKVIMPSMPRTYSTTSTSRALTVQTCTSSTLPATHPPAYLTSTVSSTVAPTQVDKMSSTGVGGSTSSQPGAKRKAPPRKPATKKPAAPRKGKAAKEKVTESSVPSLTAGDMTSQVSTLLGPAPSPGPGPAPGLGSGPGPAPAPGSAPSPASPSHSPPALVSSSLPPGISRLPSCETLALPKLEPSSDLPSTPTYAPSSTPLRLESADEDLAASTASPRRNQMRACRPVSLTDADDALDHYVSSTRKVQFHSAPRPRAPKMHTVKQYRKSAPAATTFSDYFNFSNFSNRVCHAAFNVTGEAPGIGLSDASCDAPCNATPDASCKDSSDVAGHGPSEARFDAPCESSCDAPCDATCDATCDALSDISSVSATPFIGFASEPSTSVYVVEVPSDSIKTDAVAEFDVESLLTAESPTPKLRVLEVLRSAQTDGLCQPIKLEGAEDALNNNSNSCSSLRCETKGNTDPAWAQPVSVKKIDPHIYSNEHDEL